jgi:acetamidase/formamidase
MTEHGLDAISTHSRWNRALPPRLEIDPGDTVHFRSSFAARNPATSSKLKFSTSPITVGDIRPSSRD